MTCQALFGVRPPATTSVAASDTVEVECTQLGTIIILRPPRMTIKAILPHAGRNADPYYAVLAQRY